MGKRIRTAGNRTARAFNGLRDAAEVAIYTPGSKAGLPVSILKSFAAPTADVREDAELFRERISTTVTSLLGLLGIEADPIQSREHILLSTILDHTWRNENDLDLAALIQAIQSPPVSKIGVMDVESFFPSKDRFALAMKLNNLLAAPSFEAWLEGEAAGHPAAALHLSGQATPGDLFHRASERCRAHVLRDAASEPDGRLDAGAIGNDEPACAPLHGRDLRILPAGGESAVEAAAA